MQDPTADTEWNDILREKGILPPKKEKELTEDEVVQMVENTLQEKLTIGSRKEIDRMTLDELDELEDEEDERVLLEYRNRRIEEMKIKAMQSRFGDVREISANDYVEQVNKAGDGIWVILHLYKPGIPLCSLINNYMIQLAPKFPETKFLKSISDTCIPNFPDRNLPSIFIYCGGQMKKQFIGPDELGGLNLKLDELEWMLSEVGAVKSDLEENPRKKPKDVLMSSLRQAQDEEDGDNDWWCREEARLLENVHIDGA